MHLIHSEQSSKALAKPISHEQLIKIILAYGDIRELVKDLGLRASAKKADCNFKTVSNWREKIRQIAKEI